MLNRVLYTAATAAMLLTLSCTSEASESISISSGASHEGDLVTRNGSISIGEGASVDGALESRNGRIETGASVSAGNVSTRNGAIRLGPDGRYGKIESRNGRIELGERSSAGSVESRNGIIEIGAGSRTQGLSARNGAIRIGAEATIEGAVETRNGSVSLAPESRVSGLITTRNGGTRLDGAMAEQGVRSIFGDIELEDGSRSGDDLVIEIREENANRSNGLFGFGGSRSWPEAGDIRITGGSEVDGDIVLLLPADYDEKAPVVELSADSKVTGSLRIDSRVELKVEGEVGGDIERVTP